MRSSPTVICLIDRYAALCDVLLLSLLLLLLPLPLPLLPLLLFVAVVLLRLFCGNVGGSSELACVGLTSAGVCRSIMENASGKTSSVLESAKNSFRTILTRPHLFFFSKPFALIYVSDPP